MIDNLLRFLTSLGAIRLFTAIGTVAVVLAVAHLVRRTIGAQIRDVAVRYRARKFVTLFSYLLAVLAFLSVFSDRLNGLSVAFGVAGAGIAFALQEVIASIAGWIAISVGGFYSTGDRVQVGGITPKTNVGVNTREYVIPGLCVRAGPSPPNPRSRGHHRFRPRRTVPVAHDGFLNAVAHGQPVIG